MVLLPYFEFQVIIFKQPVTVIILKFSAINKNKKLNIFRPIRHVAVCLPQHALTFHSNRRHRPFNAITD